MLENVAEKNSSVAGFRDRGKVMDAMTFDLIKLIRYAFINSVSINDRTDTILYNSYDTAECIALIKVFSYFVSTSMKSLCLTKPLSEF